MPSNIFSQKKPHHPWAWYADGSMCEVRDLKPYSYQGIDGTMFALRPSIGTAIQYGLKKGVSMTQEGMIKKWYPSSSCHQLRGGINGRFFITTNLDGEHTNFSRREIYYTQQIEGLSKQIKILKSEIASLYQVLDDMSSRGDAYYKSIVERFKLINTVRGKIDELDSSKGDKNES